jgi:molybdopterin/thiamine biosynthesis adenylyltransferase/rhodanese-related sulfurtransferase
MMSSNEPFERYQKQLLLKEMGLAGQNKLNQARVLVIGAGGLGCPALQYLAAAGIGTIGVVDFDVVEISNLQRQILYTLDDIGKPKAETAARQLRKLNPEIQIDIYNDRITNRNAIELITNYDLVIDGSDNFSTRYMVNDACVLLDKPLVYGAVLRFEGQVGVFNLADELSTIKTNYRDLFPQPPAAASSVSCNEAGVIGVLPGIIGIMQATEAIKIVTGIGKPLCNSILSYDALNSSFYEFSISPNEQADHLTPQDRAAFLNFNYDWFCGSGGHIAEVVVEEFDALRAKELMTVIDVREMDEVPLVDEFPVSKIPLSVFAKKVSELSTEDVIIVFCQSGKRSLKAAEIMTEKYPGKKVYSLKGGIEAWKRNQKNYND